MKIKISHDWTINEHEALKLQSALSNKVITQDKFNEIKYVAGVDVAYDEKNNVLVAGVAVLEANSLQEIENTVVKDVVHFPYIPGLFSFRELPPITKALEALKTTPDLIVCDGQGLAHPRRFGLACHLGVLFDVPTIGCGKTKLIGEADAPGEKRGDFSFLLDQGETIGMVLRTQDRVKPVYISIGHRISLELARHWILKLSPSYRLPETTRKADQLVRKTISSR
ncbi:deoxyribonuclease V [Aneurinibacillus tyrosinisolvens]|uniref:deoxyribonuclease V n=1 Tax=Aneurinibacillus tyrosinisolvens TaxID=1443435 RepID=UPI00063FA85D|nr:deoxyribonuclease V [Aneurinibacillus tyrosinisolvens]